METKRNEDEINAVAASVFSVGSVMKCRYDGHFCQLRLPIEFTLIIFGHVIGYVIQYIEYLTPSFRHYCHIILSIVWIWTFCQ